MPRFAPRALAVASLLLASPSLPARGADRETPASVLDLRVKDIDGRDVDLARYKGRVLLIVNTASQCGYTPQYQGLEALYEKYKARGFEVLAFPANEFGRQEPGTNQEIKDFCASRYDVTFPLFSKIVVKGQGIHPLYRFLTSPETDPKFAGDIPWNFTKFLVDRRGQVVARFEPKDTPESPKVTQAIEGALAEAK
ncbi:MAG TPA: glutathione peroxidase [Isosphaeraceae bacterium]|jgi:glutathione peroxidase